MRFTNIKLICVVILMVLLECCNSQGSTLSSNSGNFYPVPTIPPHSKTTKRTLTCACDDDDVQICANNGVTYNSLCRFECAKKKVPRLRKVSDGACSKTLTKQQYWKKSGKN